MIPILHPSWTAVRASREAHSFCMSFDSHWLAFQTPAAQLEVHSRESSHSLSVSSRDFGWLVDLANRAVLILCSGDSALHPETPRMVDLGLLKITQLVFPRDERSAVYGLFGSAEVARFAFCPTATATSELQIQQYWDVDLQPNETSFGVALGCLFSLQDGKRILRRILNPAVKPAAPAVVHEFDLEFDAMECVDGIQFVLRKGARRFTWEDGELSASAHDNIPPTAKPIKTSNGLFVSDSRVVFFSPSVGQALGESPSSEFAQQLCAANHWNDVEPERLHFALQRGKVLPAVRALDGLLERDEFPPQTLAWFRAHARFIQAHGKLAVRVQRLLQRATLAHQDELQLEIAQCLAAVRPQPLLRRATTTATAIEIDQIEVVRRSISPHLWNRWSPMESNEDVALEVLRLPERMGGVCTFLQARGAIPPDQDALEFVLDCVKRRAYQYLLLSDFARAQACLAKVGVDVIAFYRSVRAQTVNRFLRKRLGRHLAVCLGDGEEEEESLLHALEGLYPGRSHVVALRRSWADGALQNAPPSSAKQFRTPAFPAELPKAQQDWRELFAAPCPHLLDGDFAQPRHCVDSVLREAPRLDEREGEYEGDLGMKSATYVRCACLGEDDANDTSEVTPDLACDRFQGFFQLSSLLVRQSDLETRWRVLAQAGGVSDLLAPSTKAWALQYFVDYNDSRGVDAWRQRFGTSEPWQAVMQSTASPFIRDLVDSPAPIVPTPQLLRENNLIDCQDLLFPGSVYSSVFGLVLDRLGCGTAAEAKPKLGIKPYLALLALSPTEVDVPAEDLLEFPLLRQAVLAASHTLEPADSPLLLDDAVMTKLVENLFGLRSAGQPPREGKEGAPEAVELGPDFYLLHYRPHAAAKAATTQDLALVVRNLCLARPHDWRLLQSGLEMLGKFQLPGRDGLEVDVRLLSALLMHAPSEMEREIVAVFAHEQQDYAQVHRYSAFLPAADREVADLLARFCDLHGISPVGICQALRDTQERGAWASFADAFDPKRIAQAVLLPDCDLQSVWKAWLVAECGLAQSDTLYQAVSQCLESRDCAEALRRSAKAFAGSFPQLAQFIEFRLALWEEEAGEVPFPAVTAEDDLRHFALAELCKFWESTALPARGVVLGAILDLVDMDAAEFAEVLLARRSYALALAVAQTVSLELTVLRAAEKEAKRFGLDGLPSSILPSLFLNPANAVELSLGLRCALKSHSKRACQGMFDEGRARMMEWPFPETLSVLVLCGDQLPVELLRLVVVRCVAESRYAQLADWLGAQRDALPSKTKRRCWQLVCALWSPSHERDVLAVGRALELHAELAARLAT